jgi:hypothetical protein
MRLRQVCRRFSPLQDARFAMLPLILFAAATIGMGLATRW